MESNVPSKYRSIRWINVKKRKIFYGIDAKVDGEWMHVKEGLKPLFFDDQKDAVKKVKELNKELKPHHQ